MNTCFNCFENEGIKKLIEASSTAIGKCNFCGSQSNLIDINKIILHIERCINNEFQKVEVGTYAVKDVLKKYNFKAKTNVHTYIVKKLTACRYSSRTEIDFKSSPLQVQPLMHLWKQFSKSIKEENRFSLNEYELEYNDLGAKHRPYTFLKTVEDLIRSAEQKPTIKIIKELDHGMCLFRSRSLDGQKPFGCTVKDMGAPPTGSICATRLTPVGISAFYSASDENTAVEEIKTISNNFLISKWRLASTSSDAPIRVIDFRQHTYRAEDFCFFSTEDFEPRKLALFLDEFHKSISEPINKKDNTEHLDYVPTQALAEYIKIKFTDIVGIIYESSRSKTGYNICLFPERVSFVDATPSSESNAHAQSTHLYTCKLVECHQSEA